MTETLEGSGRATPPLLNRPSAILELQPPRPRPGAATDDVPLLERLRHFVCIVSSNLDEFFEVRFADTLEASKRAGTGVGAADIEALSADVHALIDEQYSVFNDKVMPALDANGIRIVNHADRSDAERRWVARFFETEVRPLLVPVGLDPASHRASLRVARNQQVAQPHRPARRQGCVRAAQHRGRSSKVPRVLAARHPAPCQRRHRSGHLFVLPPERHPCPHLGELFPWPRGSRPSHQFRTAPRFRPRGRDADVSNLRQALRSGLAFDAALPCGQAVRLGGRGQSPVPAESLGIPARASSNLGESALC